MYSITHIIFYLSDFGFKEIDIPESHIQRLYWIVSSLLGLYACEGIWDVLAELLICCDCLNFYPPMIYDAAWHSLYGAQLQDGSTPGPFFSSEKSNKMIGRAKRKYIFEENYHTTIVSIIAYLLNKRRVINRRRHSKSFSPRYQLPIIESKIALERSHRWLLGTHKSLYDEGRSIKNYLYVLLGDWIYTRSQTRDQLLHLRPRADTDQ